MRFIQFHYYYCHHHQYFIMLIPMYTNIPQLIPSALCWVVSRFVLICLLLYMRLQQRKSCTNSTQAYEQEFL